MRDFTTADGTLNPVLVDALTRAFGHPPRVLYPGQELEGYYETDPLTGRRNLKIVRRGETYLTDCFNCGDGRGRMAVNHRYAVRDPETGTYGYNLWKCYNEECQHDPAARAKLRDLLTFSHSFGFRLRPPAVRRVDPGVLPAYEFPGLLVPVDALPPDHPAVVYVRDARGFDPAELAAVWGVAYAESVPARCRGAMAQGRLICPVRLNGVTVGCQARYVGELDWKLAGVPKYLTYFPKSLTLYGIDEAAAASYIGLYEGVTDVWRHGPGGVSPLGKTLSADQARLLALRLNGRPLVLVPDQNDPEARACFCRSGEQVIAAGHTGPVGIATLPAGTDPAKLARTVLLGVTARAAARAADSRISVL